MPMENTVGCGSRDVTASNQYLNETSEYVSELGRSYSVSLEPGELIVSHSRFRWQADINEHEMLHS